jgi:Flp pilus assembly pilin Flp
MSISEVLIRAIYSPPFSSKGSAAIRAEQGRICTGVTAMSVGKAKQLGVIRERRGAVTVEYLLLVTLVGIGVLVGLAAVRNALVQELDDVAAAISAIV